MLVSVIYPFRGPKFIFCFLLSIFRGNLSFFVTTSLFLTPFIFHFPLSFHQDSLMSSLFPSFLPSFFYLTTFLFLFLLVCLKVFTLCLLTSTSYVGLSGYSHKHTCLESVCFFHKITHFTAHLSTVLELNKEIICLFSLLFLIWLFIFLFC